MNDKVKANSSVDSESNCNCDEMDDQLKHLYDYTKFHIGMYTTLIAIIVGVFSTESIQTKYGELEQYVIFALILYSLAGMCGGLIASSIPAFKKYKDFISSPLFPWDLTERSFTAKTFTHLEHLFFWAGTGLVVFGTVKEIFLQKYKIWESNEIIIAVVICIVIFLGITYQDIKYKKCLENEK